jgi:hypothetical protein
VPSCRCIVDFIGIDKAPRASPLSLHLTDTNGRLIARLDTTNVEDGTKTANFDGQGDGPALSAAIRETMNDLGIEWGCHSRGPVLAEVDIRLPPGKELRDHQASGKTRIRNDGWRIAPPLPCSREPTSLGQAGHEKRSGSVGRVRSVR